MAQQAPAAVAAQRLAKEREQRTEQWTLMGTALGTALGLMANGGAMAQQGPEGERAAPGPKAQQGMDPGRQMPWLARVNADIERSRQAGRQRAVT